MEWRIVVRAKDHKKLPKQKLQNFFLLFRYDLQYGTQRQLLTQKDLTWCMLFIDTKF